jgi:hypothetical protein
VTAKLEGGESGFSTMRATWSPFISATPRCFRCVSSSTRERTTRAPDACCAKFSALGRSERS